MGTGMNHTIDQAVVSIDSRELSVVPEENIGSKDFFQPERIPPRNYEAEQALIGALLHNNKAYEQVSDFLHPDHFAEAAHGRIYEAIGRLIDRGQIADPITLKDFFSDDEDLKEIGGASYLVKLADSVVSIINVKDYGMTIHDLSLRRQLIDLGENVVNDAFEHDIDHGAQLQIEVVEQKLFDLATRGGSERGFVPFNLALTNAINTASLAFKRDSHIVGVTTGLKGLDQLLGGLHPSDLLILAGRPSMGKTALATNIAFSAAVAAQEEKECGGVVAFFSLEMSAEQLATRLLAQESGVPSHKIHQGHVNNEDFSKFADVGSRLSTLPLYIDDTPSISVTALRSRARRLKRQKGLGLIVIDYLQLLSPPANRRRSNDGRVQEISEISRALKGIAKELDVPVLALSQLSRAVEQREDKRPMLSDLRESGSIEQDADVVLFIFRKEYYLARAEPEQDSKEHSEWSKEIDEAHNLADIIVGKQRHGPIGSVKVCFLPGLTKYGDLAEQDKLPCV